MKRGIVPVLAYDREGRMIDKEYTQPREDIPFGIVDDDDYGWLVVHLEQQVIVTESYFQSDMLAYIIGLTPEEIALATDMAKEMRRRWFLRQLGD